MSIQETCEYIYPIVYVLYMDLGNLDHDFTNYRLVYGIHMIACSHLLWENPLITGFHSLQVVFVSFGRPKQTSHVMEKKNTVLILDGIFQEQ